MSPRTRSLILTSALGILLALSGCGGSDPEIVEETSVATEPSSAPETPPSSPSPTSNETEKHRDFTQDELETWGAIVEFDVGLTKLYKSNYGDYNASRSEIFSTVKPEECKLFFSEEFGGNSASWPMLILEAGDKPAMSGVVVSTPSATDVSAGLERYTGLAQTCSGLTMTSDLGTSTYEIVLNKIDHATARETVAVSMTVTTVGEKTIVEKWEAILGRVGNVGIAVTGDVGLDLDNQKKRVWDAFDRLTIAMYNIL